MSRFWSNGRGWREDKAMDVLLIFDDQQGPYRRGPYSPEDRETYLVPLEQTFREVYPKTLDEWEDAFRRDMNLSIGTWHWMARAYRELTSRQPRQLDQKQDIFQVIVAYLNCNRRRDRVLSTASVGALTRKEVLDIIAYLDRKWVEYENRRHIRWLPPWITRLLLALMTLVICGWIVEALLKVFRVTGH